MTIKNRLLKLISEDKNKLSKLLFEKGFNRSTSNDIENMKLFARKQDGYHSIIIFQKSEPNLKEFDQVFFCLYNHKIGEKIGSWNSETGKSSDPEAAIICEWLMPLPNTFKVRD